MRSPSLSVRLVAGALVWLVLMLAAGGVTLALAFRQNVEREFSHRLDAMLRGLVAAIEVENGQVRLSHGPGDPRFEQIYSGWYWQVTPPSGPKLRSRSLWDEAIASGADGTGLAIRHADGPNRQRLLVAERDLSFPGQDGAIHVLVAGDLAEVADGVRRFDLLLAAALGLLGIGLAVAVLIQVRFGLRPLRGLAGDLDRVRAGEKARLDGNYPVEIAPLAQAVNAVLDKDEELIERARTHVGNLAHGLKNPLSVLAAEAQSPESRRQIETMRRLVEHHLGRAAGVAGAGRVLGKAVPVAEVAQGLALVLDRIFADRALSIRVEAQGALFRGHREDLEEILGNLMENACKWAESQVLVHAHGSTIRVEDDGPGLPPERIAEASQRGKRLDEMAQGWGLGLSIVADLVQVNGGRMEFSRSALGGLAVEITF